MSEQGKYLLGDEFLKALDRFIAQSDDLEQLRRVAGIMREGVDYLVEHDPRGDEHYGRHTCSGDGHHRTSCDGKCPEGDPEPWCHVAGFDCLYCGMVSELNGVLS